MHTTNWRKYCTYSIINQIIQNKRKISSQNFVILIINLSSFSVINSDCLKCRAKSHMDLYQLVIFLIHLACTQLFGLIPYLSISLIIDPWDLNFLPTHGCCDKRLYLMFNCNTEEKIGFSALGKSVRVKSKSLQIIRLSVLFVANHIR